MNSDLETLTHDVKFYIIHSNINFDINISNIGKIRETSENSVI